MAASARHRPLDGGAAGAGHFSHNDDPERFVKILSEFIAETEPADLDEEKVREMLLPDGD